MYSGLVHAHSGLRWIALLLIIATIINCVPMLTRNRQWSSRDRKLSVAAMSLLHLQALLGFALYFMSPKVQFTASTMSNSELRFFAVEHLVLMILAVAFITIGSIRAKKKETSPEKFKSIFWFFLIGLLVLVAGIPWPFRELGAAWF